MSPTAPTLATLNNQLNKAHRRIRELETREAELVAHNTTLGAVIEELTEDRSRLRLGHTPQIAETRGESSVGPPRSQLESTAPKLGGFHNFDPDPIGTIFGGNQPVPRCSNATKTSSAVVGVRQANLSYSYHPGI